MTDEDKALIWLTNQKNKKHVNTIINLIDKLQKEIEEKERLLIAKATIIRALEKEIEELKEQVNVFEKAVKCDKCDCNICDAEKIILKLQKEIDQLKKYNVDLNDEMQLIEGSVKIANLDIIGEKENYSKEKILYALGIEYRNQDLSEERICNVIKSIVNENENSISKDKIRTKIKELEEQQEKEIEKMGMSLLSVPINILKKLLEE